MTFSQPPTTNPAVAVPTYHERQREVKLISNFATDVAKGRVLSSFSTEVQTKIGLFNNWKADIRALRATGQPTSHLNHVKCFTDHQREHIIVDTIAKRIMGKAIAQALNEAEMEMEDALSAGADYDYLNYGKLPDWAPSGPW